MVVATAAVLLLATAWPVLSTIKKAGITVIAVILTIASWLYGGLNVIFVFIMLSSSPDISPPGSIDRFVFWPGAWLLWIVTGLALTALTRVQLADTGTSERCKRSPGRCSPPGKRGAPGR